MSCYVVFILFRRTLPQAHWLTADAAGAALEAVWALHVQLSPAHSLASNLHPPPERFASLVP